MKENNDYTEGKQTNKQTNIILKEFLDLRKKIVRKIRLFVTESEIPMQAKHIVSIFLQREIKEQCCF